MHERKGKNNNYEDYNHMPTILDKNIGTTTKNGVVREATSIVKLFIETIWGG